MSIIRFTLHPRYNSAQMILTTTQIKKSKKIKTLSEMAWETPRSGISRMNEWGED